MVKKSQHGSTIEQNRAGLNSEFLKWPLFLCFRVWESSCCLFCVRNQLKKDKIEPKQIFWRGYTYDYFRALRKDPGSSATEWNSDDEPAQVEQKLWKPSAKEKYISFKNHVLLITHTHLYRRTCAHLHLSMAFVLVLITRHVYIFIQEANKHNYQFLFISIAVNILMQNSTNDCETWSPLQQQQQSKAPWLFSYLYWCKV